MRLQNNTLGAAIAIAAVLAALELSPSRALAADARLTVTPAIQHGSDTGSSGANVQFVQWGRPYGYRYRGYYGPYYGRGYYYRPYYGYPVYGGYGYSYPAYGYGYPGYAVGYPAYGYGYPAYGGIGIRAGGVGVGIW